MMNFRFYFLLSICSFFLISVFYLLTSRVAQADEFTSPSFKVLDPIIKIGGGFSTSSGYQLWSSFGQEAIGISDSAAFQVRGGFLYIPAPSAATSPPPAQISPAAAAGRLLPKEKVLLFCDFNGDKVCNLIDLSILLFYYGKSGPQIERFDLNKNGRVDFVDVSILFYYWTE